MNKKTQQLDNDPSIGCVLHEKARSGEWFKYSYPQNGLPEMRVKSAPAWSFLEDYCEQEKKRSKK